MEKPFLYEGSDPLPVSVPTAFSVVRSIMEADQEDQFLNSADVTRASVDLQLNFIKTPLSIPAPTAYQMIKTIILAGEEAEFSKVSENADITVVVPSEIINYVKNFLFDKGIHKNSLEARSAVTSARCRPSRR